MDTARLPAAAIGNGQLLVTIDAWGDILSSCWPQIDSPNQMPTFRIMPAVYHDKTQSTSSSKPQFGYVGDSNIFSAITPDHISIQDTVIGIPVNGGNALDVHIRHVKAPHPALSVYVIPELDGRSEAQTIYWDEENQALLAYCRHNWVAIGSTQGRVSDFHCGRRDDESSASHFLSELTLPSERISFRKVDAALRIVESMEHTLVYAVYGKTREEVIAGLVSVRTRKWHEIEVISKSQNSSALAEMTLSSSFPKVNNALRRSSLVLDLLSNRTTGGVIAGPDVQSGIASAPGYAAVWGRDAAFTALGALAMGRIGLAKHMLQFAIATQSPEGLWLHRHHTDYTLASSWGLHQIDETGIYLHTMAAYAKSSGDKAFVKGSWNSVAKAANFLCEARDQESGLPIKSIDLWEEREGFQAYTAASVIAGLKAAAIFAIKMNEASIAQRWNTVAKDITAAALLAFWRPKENRFITSVQSSAALPMVDAERPELSAKVQRGGVQPATALGQYPNWRDKAILKENLGHDVSVLSLAVPFGILPVKDPRIVSTAKSLREKLWNPHVGGLCRYEGDSYGGGNPWPLATLWLAIYEGACGNADEAQKLIDWVIDHSTAADLVPEQVHRESGLPVAAVPLSWSHAMIALAVAAAKGEKVWDVVG